MQLCIAACAGMVGCDGAQVLALVALKLPGDITPESLQHAKTAFLANVCDISVKSRYLG